MKKNILRLMRHRFTSQWMEMIDRNTTDPSDAKRIWREEIAGDNIGGALSRISCAGCWSRHPLGQVYWERNYEELTRI